MDEDAIVKRKHTQGTGSAREITSNVIFDKRTE